MKHFFSVFSLLLVTSMSYAVKQVPLVYNGDTLEFNDEFKRVKCGMSPSTMPEISGMSCSRVTPGYLWIQSDDNYRVEAMTEDGKIVARLILKERPARTDWEGLSLGMYRGKSTIFVGGFGDNSLQYADYYFIFYFDEPEIVLPKAGEKPKVDTIRVKKNYIKYGYPDGKAHNTEAVMYDNVEEVLYIVDKMDHTCCSVYSLDMKDTVYGTDLVRLTKVCDLGLTTEDRFQRVTAADMTWDGKWIIIKNYDVYRETAYALLWEREGDESLKVTLKRQPKQIKAYELEWQGEAVAWLDSTTFYTTSDENGSAPIYKYTRWIPEGIEEIESAQQHDASVVMVNGQFFIRKEDKTYTLNGQKVE